jgi:hypothetical protein
MCFMPFYKNASYAGETVVLQNAGMRVEFHKRLTGWGWAEICNGQSDPIAVLDHLGEILLCGQEIPMRLEAADVRRETGEFGSRLVCAVRSLIVRDSLRGSSFQNWIDYPLDKHILEGEVILTLAPDRPALALSYRFTAKGNVTARYVRGPWLKVGQDAFGTEKDDALFPGVEWLVGAEWSSGTDWFKDPWAKRWMPHPHKVTAPVMAVSRGGTGIGLAWNPDAMATSWFNNRRCLPQPVFASPNFLDRRNNHLLGLMVPDAGSEDQENRVEAEPPLELHLEQRIAFNAEIFLCEGNSLDVLVAWVQRNGMPAPPLPRWPLPEALHRIATAYATHLWHEDRGFGNGQTPNDIRPHPPRFAARYLEQFADSAPARDLQAKVEWCRSQSPQEERSTEEAHVARRGRGEELLSHQRPDGSFAFDPDGRHYRKDDFVVARAFLEPMGLAGDTALDITLLPALELLRLAEGTGDADFRAAARRALDYCLPIQRPEGGDFWETPLHAPNLLAAGHAACAYLLGYRAFPNEECYRRKAIYWIRALLPFTHLWEPSRLPMLYNTKPCLCSSDWYFANWVRDHVQWEVLETFALSTELGIDWQIVDPALEWRTYHRGITVAALRWMLDRADGAWLPHNLPDTYDSYLRGDFDACFADTHNSVTGHYGGMAILPDVIALNLMAVLAYREETA